MAKSAEEKAADIAAKKLKDDAEERALAEARGDLPEDPNREPTDEELLADSKRVEEEQERIAEEKRKARESVTPGNPNEKMYSETTVKAMLKQMQDELRKEFGGKKEELDPEEQFKQKKVRMARFKEKFVVGFENRNDDPYFPELVIHAFDVYDKEKRQNIAYVKAIFQDKSTLLIPLFTLLSKSKPVYCDLVEVKEENTSYSDGKVERADIKDYSRVGTGSMVNAKVTQADYKYVVKLPDGEEITVGPEVVNW